MINDNGTQIHFNTSGTRQIVSKRKQLRFLEIYDKTLCEENSIQITITKVSLVKNKIRLFYNFLSTKEKYKRRIIYVHKSTVNKYRIIKSYSALQLNLF